MGSIPGELEGVELERLLPSKAAASGGFLVFAFSAPHVAGPQQEGVVWTMATLPAFLHYHIRAAKTMMHTHMRRRVEVMLGVMSSGTGSGSVGAQ